MKWKCPECGLENSDTSLECTCGYAFYKMLGVKPDASPEEIHQTYQYLKKVWEENIKSEDPVMKQKAQERMKKIDEAYDIYKQFVPGYIEAEKRKPFIKIAFIAGIAVIFMAGVLIFFFVSRKETSRQQSSHVRQEAAISSDRLGEHHTDEGDQRQYAEEYYPDEETVRRTEQPVDLTSLSGKEKAIELVKRSRGIDRFYSEEFNILNWDAKKVDAQKYIVSFTASKGSNTSKYYFDTDIKNGIVRHITDRRELQRYGIQQSDFAGYRLDVTVPEYVQENTEFKADVVIRGRPETRLAISEKMFFISSNGCEVTIVNGAAPRRFSDIFPGYEDVSGTQRDPYIPSDKYIELDSRGQAEIPVTLKAGSYSERMPRVGASSEDRGCILNISISTFAQVETWVVVEKKK